MPIVRLRLRRAPFGTAAYQGPVTVAEGWYLVVARTGGVAHVRQWAGDETPSSPGFALVSGGFGRRAAVAFLAGWAESHLTVRLYGAAAPETLDVWLRPVPRAVAAPVVGAQNLRVMRGALAGPGTLPARLRAGMALAGTLGPDVPVRFAMAVQDDLDRAAYRSWIRRFDTLGPADRAAIAATLPVLPPVLVVGLCNAAEAPALMQDLQRQMHARWRVVLPHCPGFDPAALRLRPGECLLVAGAATRLREHALSTLAAAAGPGIRLVYADEDRLDEAGERTDPFFKPGFSPDLLAQVDYLGGCVLLAGEGLDALARDPAGIAAHAAGLPPSTVVRVPLVLSHRTRARPAPAPAMAPCGAALPTVSIVIPTRDRIELLSACLSSIDRVTDYDPARREVIVVDNGSADPAALSFLDQAAVAGRIRLLRDPAPFNYPRLNNLAAAASQAEVLVFLNNDTEVTDPLWLRRLAGHAMQPGVGAVGGKLLYPDGTVQHAGVVVGMAGVAAHAFAGLAPDDPGYHGLAAATREVAAVTAACLAVRRSVFDRAGGFDPALAVAFNDVVLCTRLLALGYRNLTVAAPLLTHHESKSRGADDTPEKAARFAAESSLARGQRIEDPFYNPNLAYAPLYTLAYPPRRGKPWGRPAGPVRVLLLDGTPGQAAELEAAGLDVRSGGRSGPILLQRAEDAAAYAVEHDIDWLVIHAAPFFAVPRYVGHTPRTILCDHGVPPAALFRDAGHHRRECAERLVCLDLVSHVIAPEDALLPYVSSRASQ